LLPNFCLLSIFNYSHSRLIPAILKQVTTTHNLSKYRNSNRLGVMAREEEVGVVTLLMRIWPIWRKSINSLKMKSSCVMHWNRATLSALRMIPTTGIWSSRWGGWWMMKTLRSLQEGTTGEEEGEEGEDEGEEEAAATHIIQGDDDGGERT